MGGCFAHSLWERRALEEDCWFHCTLLLHVVQQKSEKRKQEMCQGVWCLLIMEPPAFRSGNAFRASRKEGYEMEYKSEDISMTLSLGGRNTWLHRLSNYVRMGDNEMHLRRTSTVHSPTTNVIMAMINSSNSRVHPIAPFLHLSRVIHPFISVPTVHPNACSASS